MNGQVDSVLVSIHILVCPDVEALADLLRDIEMNWGYGSRVNALYKTYIAHQSSSVVSGVSAGSNLSYFLPFPLRYVWVYSMATAYSLHL